MTSLNFVPLDKDCLFEIREFLMPTKSHMRRKKRDFLWEIDYRSSIFIFHDHKIYEPKVLLRLQNRSEPDKALSKSYMLRFHPEKVDIKGTFNKQTYVIFMKNFEKRRLEHQKEYNRIKLIDVSDGILQSKRIYYIITSQNIQLQRSS